MSGTQSSTAAIKAALDDIQRTKKKAIEARHLEAKRKDPEAIKQQGIEAVGVTSDEIDAMRRKAKEFVRRGPDAFAELQDELLETSLVVMWIDALLGTEPWRNAAAGAKEAAQLGMEARARCMRLASQVLADMKDAEILRKKQLAAGVIDAEVSD